MSWCLGRALGPMQRMFGSAAVQAVRPLLPDTVNSWARLWRSVQTSWPPEYDSIVQEIQASTAAAVLGVDKGRNSFVGRGSRRAAGRKGRGGALHAAAVAPTAEQHLAAERAAQDLLAEVRAYFPPSLPVPLSQLEVTPVALHCTTTLLCCITIRRCTGNLTQSAQSLDLVTDMPWPYCCDRRTTVPQPVQPRLKREEACQEGAPEGWCSCGRQRR